MKIIRFIIAGIIFIFSLVILLPVLLLTTPLWLYYLTYFIIYKIGKSKIAKWENMIEFNSEIGWKPKPNLDTKYIDNHGDMCSIITDSTGWPGDTSIHEADVVVIGDSFAFGYGAYYKNSYAKIDENFKIKPLAAPGYNMAQAVLLLKKYAANLEGKEVVWFVCLENDLYDNILPYHPGLQSTPFVVNRKGENNWSIQTDHVNSKKGKQILSNIRNYPKFYAKISVASAFSNRVYSAAEYLIREAGKICNDHDISISVMGIPYKFHLSENGIKNNFNKYLSEDEIFNVEYIDSHISQMCRQQNMEYVSLREQLTTEDYKRYDTHWNNQGNQKVGQILKTFICTHKHQYER